MLTSTQVPGGLNWLDLGTPDIDAAVAFYTGLFGWQFQSAGPEAGGYGFLQKDGKTVGAARPADRGGRELGLDGVLPHRGRRRHRQVRRAGGRLRPRPAVGGLHGRADGRLHRPGGRRLRRVGTRRHRRPGARERPRQRQLDRAVHHRCRGGEGVLRHVLSWETRDMPMGGGIVYSIAGPAGGGEQTMHGGLMQLPQENRDAGSASEWHPYFEVEDCDATVASAQGLGATVIIAATDGEGVGRFAMLLDPFGAPFAVITSATA